MGLAAGGPDLFEVCGGLDLMGGLAFFEVCAAGLGLAAGPCLAFFNVGAALGLAAGGLDFNLAGAFALGEVGARCAEEAPRLPPADAGAWATLLDA